MDIQSIQTLNNTNCQITRENNGLLLLIITQSRNPIPFTRRSTRLQPLDDLNLRRTTSNPIPRPQVSQYPIQPPMLHRFNSRPHLRLAQPLSQNNYYARNAPYTSTQPPTNFVSNGNSSVVNASTDFRSVAPPPPLRQYFSQTETITNNSNDSDTVELISLSPAPTYESSLSELPSLGTETNNLASNTSNNNNNNDDENTTTTTTTNTNTNLNLDNNSTNMNINLLHDDLFYNGGHFGLDDNTNTSSEWSSLNSNDLNFNGIGSNTGLDNGIFGVGNNSENSFENVGDDSISGINSLGNGFNDTLFDNRTTLTRSRYESDLNGCDHYSLGAPRQRRRFNDNLPSDYGSHNSLYFEQDNTDNSTTTTDL